MICDSRFESQIAIAVKSQSNRTIWSTWIETFIARTAGDSREMRKTCAEALSGPPSHLSPKLCENCARTTFAQISRKKWGSRTIFARFF